VLSKEVYWLNNVSMAEVQTARQIELIEEGLEGTWIKDRVFDRQPERSLDFTRPLTTGNWGKLEIIETDKEYIPMEYKIILKNNRCFIVSRIEKAEDIHEFELKNYLEMMQANSWVGYLYLNSAKGSENYTRSVPRSEP